MRRSGLLGESPYDANWDRNNFVPSHRPPSRNHHRHRQHAYHQSPPPHPHYQRFPHEAHNPTPPRPRYQHYGPRPPGPPLSLPAQFAPPPNYFVPTGPPPSMLQPTRPDPFPPPPNTSCQANPSLMPQQYYNEYPPEEPYEDNNMVTDEYPSPAYADYTQTQNYAQPHFVDLEFNTSGELPSPYSNHEPFYSEGLSQQIQQILQNSTYSSNSNFPSQQYDTAPVHPNFQMPQSAQQFQQAVVPPPNPQMFHPTGFPPVVSGYQESSRQYAEAGQSFDEFDRDIFKTPSPVKPYYETNSSATGDNESQGLLLPSTLPEAEVARGFTPAPDSFTSIYGSRNSASEPPVSVAPDNYCRPYLANVQRTNRSSSNSSSRDSRSRSPMRQQSPVTSVRHRQSPHVAPGRPRQESPVPAARYQSTGVLPPVQQQRRQELPAASVRPPQQSSGVQPATQLRDSVQRPRTDRVSGRPAMPTPTLTQRNQPLETIPAGVSPVRHPPPLPDPGIIPRHQNDAPMSEPPLEKPPDLPSVSSRREEEIPPVDASSSTSLLPSSFAAVFQLSPVNRTVHSAAVTVSPRAELTNVPSPVLRVSESSTASEVTVQNNALLPTSPVHSDISEQPSVGSVPSLLPEPPYTSPRTESDDPAFPHSTSVPHSPATASDSGQGSTNASVVDEAVERSSAMAPSIDASPQPENQPSTLELVSNSKSSASKAFSMTKSLSAVRPPSSSSKKTENAGSASKTSLVDAETQKSVLLEQQNIVHSVFRQHERLQNAQALLQPSSPSSSSRLSRERSMETAETSSIASGSSIRAKPRTRMNSEEGSLHSREEGVGYGSLITTLEVTPRKLGTQDIHDLNLMIKKQRKSEALLPNYQSKEPKRMLGIFAQKLLLDFKKLVEGLNRPEKKRQVECIGRISINDVVNILKNDMSERDMEMLQNIAVFAAKHHSKQENFTTYFCLLIANGIDLNVKDEDGLSILGHAMRTGDLALMDLLLPYTEHVDLDSEGNSVLHIAHRLWKADPRNKWDIVTLVIENDKAPLMFAKNKVYRTAISLFCGEHQLFKNDELEAFLLEYGTKNIEAEPESLLHCLAAARRVELISFCLGFFPFNPNRVDADNRTFMHRLAELSGLTRHEAELMMDMVRICGAKTTIADKKNLTAIDVATRCGNQELVRLWNKYSKVANTFEAGSFVGDISFGREVKPIKVINEKSLASLKDFVYIRENIYLGEAPSLKGMMYCGCRAGQCSTTTCQCLKRGLAYSRSGTIVPGTCKGNPIFECGPHCACGPDCSSRVVQKGIRMPFEIFMTTKRGWGVRATRTIQPGEFIMEFVGEIIESDRLLARDPHNDWAMELTIDNYDGTMYHVDPTRCGNVARFLNHSCDPNLFPVRVYVSGDALDTGVRMAMFSAQVVGKGHELTFHYGDLYWQRQVDKSVYCACGSSKCKFQAKKRKK